jgi:limonene-1,2-epoxide hydrolase
MTQATQRYRRLVLAVMCFTALAVTLALFVCTSSAPRDFVGNGRTALDRTQSAVTHTAQAPKQSVDASIERFLALFSEFEPAAVEAAARRAYAPDAYFHDGFAELEGGETVAAYLRRTAEASTELKVRIEDRVVADGEVYLRWTMLFTTAGSRSRTIVAPGITHLRFDDEGRIVYHRDYWDASGALAEFVPGVGSILRRVKKSLESD